MLDPPPWPQGNTVLPRRSDGLLVAFAGLADFLRRPSRRCRRPSWTSAPCRTCRPPRRRRPWRHPCSVPFVSEASGLGGRAALVRDELEQRHRRGVARPLAELDDAGVAAAARQVARRELVEQLHDGAAVAHHPARHAHRVDDARRLLGGATVRLLREDVAHAPRPGDGPLGQPAGLLRLGVRRADPLVGQAAPPPGSRTAPCRCADVRER